MTKYKAHYGVKQLSSMPVVPACGAKLDWSKTKFSHSPTCERCRNTKVYKEHQRVKLINHIVDVVNNSEHWTADGIRKQLREFVPNLSNKAVYDMMLEARLILKKKESNRQAELKSRKYYGLTYPKILDNKFIKWLWRKLMCKYGYHLFDEVLSIEHHYLSCDACGSEVHIETVCDEYVEK